MDWTPGGMSNDVEDRRGSSGGGGFGGMGGGGLGIVGFLILLVLSLVTGRNYIGAFLSSGGGQGSTQSGSAVAGRTPSASDNRDAQLVSFVLDDAQKTWTQIFAAEGKAYRHAKLVLYRDATFSGCGTAQATTGPFYCPADEKVYVDLNFWSDLKRMGGNAGEFAQAYVIAHELGHHIQKLTGIESRMRRLSQQDPGEAKELSVDLELQADCFAGVWAHSTQQRNIVNQSDIEGALQAAAAVGDDHLQRMSGRAVTPETWTHGSSAQRSSWFRTGLTSGDMRTCSTFNGSMAP